MTGTTTTQRKNRAQAPIPAHVSHRHEIAALDQLTPNPRNPRKHSKRQIRALARGISELGFNTAITVDEGYNILAGHGRYAAAQELKLREVPVLVVSGLTPAQREAFLIADNKLGDMSAFDPGLLIESIEQITLLEPEFDLTLTGFVTAEIDPLLNAKRTAEQNDLDDALPDDLPKHAVSRTGDIWELGEHRLGCGDATDGTFIECIIGPRKVGLVVSDTPFNLRIAGVVSGLGRKKHSDFAMAAGEMSPEEFVAFLCKSIDAFLPHLVDGTMVLLFIDWRHVAEMLEAGAGSDLELKNILVWVKDNAGMGSLWRSQHELICAFKHGTAAHRNNVELGVYGRHRSNVLQYPGMNSIGKGRGKALELHATVKPVALISDLILDVSDRDDVVLDPFGGSGTTIIAAEIVGRKACLCEIEPLFVDVSVRRWQERTGGEARLEATGQTFDEIEAERLAAKEPSDV